MTKNKRGLTSRQEQVLQALRDGLSVKEIAALLKISSRTVREHLEVLKQKFDARSLQHLMARAATQKPLPPDSSPGGREEEGQGSISGSA